MIPPVNYTWKIFKTVRKLCNLENPTIYKKVVKCIKLRTKTHHKLSKI